MVEAGHQAALMAPTELLSEQHFSGFQKWFEPLGIKASGPPDDSACAKTALESIEAGAVDIVIGTHALFERLPSSPWGSYLSTSNTVLASINDFPHTARAKQVTHTSSR